MYSLFHSFIHSSFYLLIHSFIHSFIHSSIYSFISWIKNLDDWLPDWSFHKFIHKFIHPLIGSFIQSSESTTHSFDPHSSFIQSTTHPLQTPGLAQGFVRWKSNLSSPSSSSSASRDRLGEGRIGIAMGLSPVAGRSWPNNSILNLIIWIFMLYLIPYLILYVISIFELFFNDLSSELHT